MRAWNAVKIPRCDLPAPLVERIDAVASAEMRSRSNATRWLLSQALEQREPVEVVEPAEAG
jgi:metal-responsive CopG/Arc/MetJ family transcriptional regulator